MTDYAAPRAASWTVKVWASDHSTDCVRYAYGQAVLDYLKTHYCRGVTRMLASSEVGGHLVVITQEYVGFADPPSWDDHAGGTPPSYGYALGFKVLVTRSGTGGLRAMITDGYHFPGSGTAIRYPNAFDSEAQDSGAEMAEIWYADRPTTTNEPALVKLAKSIYLQLT